MSATSSLGKSGESGTIPEGMAPGGARGARPIRRKVVFALVFLALLVVGAELGLRVVHRVVRGSWVFAPTLDAGRKMYRVHPSSNYSLVPGYEMSITNRMDISIGESGFRQAPESRNKPAGTIRIACLGGSTTFCTYATRAERTWPAQMGAKLGAMYPGLHFEIINAGVAGYTTAESLPTLALRVLEYEPDIVIVHHVLNDAKPVSFDDGFRSDYTHWRQASIKTGDEPWWASTAVYRTFEYVRFKLRASARPLGSAAGPILLGVATFERNLETMIAIARRFGAEPVLMTMASMFPSEDISPENAEKEAANRSVLREFYSDSGVLVAMRTMNQSVRDVADQNQVVLVDMVNRFPKDGDYFEDVVHKNDAGLEAFAEMLTGELVSSGVIERARAVALSRATRTD